MELTVEHGFALGAVSAMDHGAFGQVSTKGSVTVFLPALQAADIGVADEAVFIRRDIEQQLAIAAYGAEIDVHQGFGGFDLVVLGGVVEPTRADGDVRLGWVPNESFGL